MNTVKRKDEATYKATSLRLCVAICLAHYNAITIDKLCPISPTYHKLALTIGKNVHAVLFKLRGGRNLVP